MFPEINLLRLTAVVAMLIYHFLFLLIYFKLSLLEYSSGPLHWLGQYARFTFLILVGLCLSISYQKWQTKNHPQTFYLRQLKRGLTLLLIAILITISTYLFTPTEYIKFGILHHIATVILLSLPLIKYPKLSLALALSLIFFTPAPSLPNTPLNYILGLSANIPETWDYFSLLQWFPLTLIGIFLGHYLYRNNHRQFQLPKFLSTTKLGLTGKSSLIIYLIHPPAFYLILKLLNLSFFKN